jgi:hypothetical protein
MNDLASPIRARKYSAIPKPLGGSVCLIWLAAGGLLGAPPEVQPAGAVNRTIRVDVDRARSVALRKLERSECRLIFSDFTDSAGQTLQQNLESRNVTGADLLGRLTFDDATGRPPCKSDGVLAFTTPGTNAISICAPGFRQALREHRDLAANILLHEELHSLGLEELSRFAPPSSEHQARDRRMFSSMEITDRVASRCGS